jgi:hypothetical protein
MSSVESFLDKFISTIFLNTGTRRRKSLEKMREKRNSRLEEVYGINAKRASFENHPFNGNSVDNNLLASKPRPTSIMRPPAM